MGDLYMDTDDVQIVSRIRSSRMKSSSCILILRIDKKELSCTGVAPATEPPMPKLEWVTKEKLYLVGVSVSVCFSYPFSFRGSRLYIPAGVLLFYPLEH